MTAGRSTEEGATAARDWPDFRLTPTYNPTFLPRSVTVDTDEVVIHDDEAGRGHWISAARDAHVPLPDCR